MKQILSIILLTLMTNIAFSQEKASEKRLDEVALRGRHVMPFSLEKTTHVFSKTTSGGIQQVIAKSPDDAEQIQLIRTHLAKIANEFQQGLFTDPKKIHGANMPGLETLKNTQAGQLVIRYKTLPAGAQIHYSSENPKLITAIHQFFDAQLKDHARHAISGHAMHKMYHQ
jgi:hypothetical protein